MGAPSNDLNISQAGYVVFDGVATFTGRTFQAGTGISIGNASGVAGNTTISLSGGTPIGTINGDTGSITGSTVTIFANNSANNAGSSVLFTNSGTTSTFNVTDSHNNTIIGKGSGNSSFTSSDNVGLGKSVLSSLSGASTSSNIAIGDTSLTTLSAGVGRNVAIGLAALGQLVNGVNNIAIGYQAGLNMTGAETNNISIGNTGPNGVNGRISLGTPTTHTTFFAQGIAGVTTSNSQMVTIDTTTGQLGSISSTSVDFHDSRFIVSNTDLTHGANYSTIAAAITAAVSLGAPQTIFIQPGTYTENLTLAAGINLCAHACDAYAAGSNSPNVIILGKCTATFAGNCSLSGIQLKTNSDFCLSVTGNSATLVNLKGCFIDANNNTAIQFTSSSGLSKIQLYDCKGDIDTTGISYFTHSAAGSLKIYNGAFENNGGSSTAATSSGTGGVEIRNMYFSCPITTTGTSTIIISSTEYHGPLIHNSTSSSGNSIDKSSIDGGSSSAVSIGAGAVLVISNSTISSSNTNAITGSGSLTYGNLIFNNTSSLINTTTQIPETQSNNAVRITTPGAYPYTTIPQDGVILVDTSSARTITPLASPTTGQRHRIKDNVGSAAANNITITPSGKNIDGSASYVIATNWGSADIVYNGTQWNVI